MKLPSYKEILELLKKGATLDAQEKIMQLREASLELQEENIALRERITALEREKEIRDKLIFDGKVYWLAKKDTNSKIQQEGPFCQKCFDSDGKLVRLQNYDKVTWLCANCSHSFRK